MLLIVGMIVYTFRDQAGPILEQLKKTTPGVITGICVMTVLYHLVEGKITTVLAREYRPEFPYKKGVGNAFFCSFYRVATLGGGAGIAGVVYLGENGIAHSTGFGLYMLQYAFHKISIAIFSVVFFACNWSYMYRQFEDYMGLLLAGYALTLVITVFLILFCCSRAFHKVLFLLLDAINRKFGGRFAVPIATLRGECAMLEEASRHILKRKSVVAWVIVLNVLRNCFWYGIPYLSFRGYSDVTLMQTMAVTSLSVMLAAVIPAPAGIGSTEVMFIALFSGIVGAGHAGSAALLYRFGTFVFPFLVGAVVVIIRRIRIDRKTAAGQSL